MSDTQTEDDKKPYYINRYGYAVPRATLQPVNPDLASGQQPGAEGTIEQPRSYGSIWIFLFIFLIALIYLSVVYVAGYHAFTEYSDDMPHVKWMRILIAVLFAPLYIGYVLIKSFFINFINSDANSFDFSLLDYIANIFGSAKIK